MKLLKTKINGLKLVKSKIFKDQRGFLRETYKKQFFNKKFIFDIMSFSKKDVLRGLHIQTKKPQAKLITVTNGKIYDVVVDLRVRSKTFGKYFSIIISKDSDFSFYIPEGFAHGFLCLTKECTVNYKCSEYRHEKSETTLNWGDKEIGIKWPIKKPILSKKDKKGINLSFFKNSK
ncbi:dTDP-4-dehydrorhamnose 3,5-epimerase [Candidatus Pelagibacter sp.]|nr:dTDP-4-dehydrorhamnose 3,5-epimerase [Candidatus Pelagibacter sp.]